MEGLDEKYQRVLTELREIAEQDDEVLLIIVATRADEGWQFATLIPGVMPDDVRRGVVKKLAQSLLDRSSRENG